MAPAADGLPSVVGGSRSGTMQRTGAPERTSVTARGPERTSGPQVVGGTMQGQRRVAPDGARDALGKAIGGVGQQGGPRCAPGVAWPAGRSRTVRTMMMMMFTVLPYRRETKARRGDGERTVRKTISGPTLMVVELHSGHTRMVARRSLSKHGCNDVS